MINKKFIKLKKRNKNKSKAQHKRKTWGWNGGVTLVKLQRTEAFL